MLIIERRFGQSLWVGDAYVTVTKGNGATKVRLQITAPEGVKVRRQEVVDEEERIKRQ